RAGRSGPASEVRRRQRRTALRAGDAFGDALDHLERPVAVRAAAVSTVGTSVREVDHPDFLAGVADGETTPVAGPTGPAPAEVQLAGAVAARPAALFDSRPHAPPSGPSTLAA